MVAAPRALAPDSGLVAGPESTRPLALTAASKNKRHPLGRRVRRRYSGFPGRCRECLRLTPDSGPGLRSPPAGPAFAGAGCRFSALGLRASCRTAPRAPAKRAPNHNRMRVASPAEKARFATGYVLSKVRAPGAVRNRSNNSGGRTCRQHGQRLPIAGKARPIRPIPVFKEIKSLR